MRRNLNFNFLETFLSLAQSLNFSKTASELKVSQPCISRQVRLLEEQLGFQLFLRNQHEVALTRQGRELYQRLNPAWSQLEQAIETCQMGKEEIRGEIHLGCLTEIGQHRAMKKLLQFKKQHPLVTLQISYLKGFEVIEQIKTGQLDFGIIGHRADGENLLAFQLAAESAILVTREQNRQEPKDFEDTPFVVYRRGDPLLGQYLKKFRKTIGLKSYQEILSVNSHQSMLEALLAFDYFSVMPRHFISRHLEQGLLRQVGRQELTNDVFLIHPHNPLLSPRDRAFKSFLLKERI